MLFTCCKLIPSKVERKVFWMLSEPVLATLEVKPRRFKLGKPSKSMFPTDVSCGKESALKIWQLDTVKVPPMFVKESAPTVVMALFEAMFKSPVMDLTEARLMVSVVPVAMAMDPE